MTATRPRHRRDRSHIALVTSREELIYLLSRASELEHGLACIYLFAAFSLKNDVSEGGLTPAQAEMVRRWKRRLSGVAVEEMLHLAQVSNMLTAIGGAPPFASSPTAGSLAGSRASIGCIDFRSLSFSSPWMYRLAPSRWRRHRQYRR